MFKISFTCRILFQILNVHGTHLFCLPYKWIFEAYGKLWYLIFLGHPVGYCCVIHAITWWLYFVLSRERPWRHWSRPRIHAARLILYASISVFLLNAWENTQVAHAVTSVFLRNTRWRHGRSWGETKYIYSKVISILTRWHLQKKWKDIDSFLTFGILIVGGGGDLWCI